MKICALLSLTAGAAAQVPDPPDNFVTEDNSTGVAAFTSYAGHRENVNLNNLNLNIVIPLITLRGRNGLDVEVVAHYNSVQREWVEREMGPLGDLVCSLEGISEAGAEEFYIQLEPRLTYEAGELSSTTPFPRRHRYVLREADGTRHELRLRDNDADAYNQNNWVLPGRFRSTGSSHLSLQEFTQPDGSFDPIVYLPDGRQIAFDTLFPARGTNQAQHIQDSNGNRVTFEWNAGQVTKLVDTLGREVRRSFNATTGTTTIEVDTASGQILTWVLTETELTLPSGLSYRFEWDFEGPFTDPCEASQSRTDKRLVRIFYPAGGSTRYEWTVPPLPNNIKTMLHKRHTCDRADGLACTASEEHTFTSVRDFPGGFTQVTRPDGTFSRHHFIPFAELNDEQKEVRTERFTASSNLLQTVEQEWDIYGRDPKVVEVRNKLHDTGAAPLVKRRMMAYDEDGYARPGRDLSTGNLVTLEEYAWGQGASGPLLRRTENDYLVSPSYGIESGVHILDRLTQTQIFDGSGELGSQSDFFYDEYTTLSGFSRSLISVSPIQKASGYGTGYTTRGNPSRRLDWLNDGPDPVTLFRYDTAGNLRRLRDPNGNVSITGYSLPTEFAYPSSTTNAVGHVESFQYDYNATFDRGWGRLTSGTDANGRSTSMAYDILGRVKRIDFPDGGIVRNYYSDLEPSAVHHDTGFPVFPDQTQLPLRTKTYTLIESSPFLERESFEVADGLARLSLRGLLNGAEMDWTGSEYDGNERLLRVSNPLTLFYGFGSDVPDPGFVAWTATSYDALDRVTGVETPDGDSVVTVYSGSQTTVTDQVGASRRSTTDALGRIVEVREPDPSSGSLDSGDFSDTIYSYDMLDNLTGVLQGLGASDQDGFGGDGITQSRSFRYDSLSRLVEESHPESGTTRYGYDANGNLVERTDARGRRTDNDYDALNRIVSTSYAVDGDPSRTDPTAPVSYFYDGSTSLNRRGRLSSVTDGAGSSSFEYDPMGRIARSVRTTRGKTVTADYSYTFLGGVRTASYEGVSPSGYTLVYSYDSQGRQETLSDGAATPFITGYSFRHNLTTADEQTSFANGTIETIRYNNRLQPERRQVLRLPTFSALMDQFYSFEKPGGGGNNGNIWEIGDFITFQSRHFSYDWLNRLTSASNGWTISYSYDRFGNRLSALASGSPPGFQSISLAIEPATNRIIDAGWEYDSAGNVIEDGGLHHFRWDSAGRLIEMGLPQPSGSGPPGDDGRCTGEPGCPPPPPPPPDPDPPLDDGRSTAGFKAQSAGTMLYEYDYQSRRVVKDEGGTGRLYFWDEVFGEVIWEFPLENPSSQDVVRGFLNGRLVVENDTRPGGGLHFMHRDHLGTSKLMTDYFSGAKVCDETYHPFGQVQTEQPFGCNGHVRKFTGKERDEESGMDYFGARYSDKVTGRFMSVDPSLESADLTNPQTWNRYSYVMNNPLKFVDPDGRNPIAITEVTLIILGTTTLAVLIFPEVVEPEGISATTKEIKETIDFAFSSLMESALSVDFTFDVLGTVVPTTIDQEPIEARSKGGRKARDSSKGEKHGDSGRRAEKLEGQIKELEQKLEELERTQGPRSEKVKLRTKIKNLKDEASRARKGEEHGRRARGQ